MSLSKIFVNNQDTGFEGIPLQETGQSTTSTMSQKVITDLIEKTPIRNILNIEEKIERGGTVEMVDGKVIIHQTSLDHIGFRMMHYNSELSPEYALVIKAKCQTDTQTITVGFFSSNYHQDDYTKHITIDDSEKYYVIEDAHAINESAGKNYFELFIGILQNNIHINNDVTISEAYFISKGDIEYLKESIPSYIESSGILSNISDEIEQETIYATTGNILKLKEFSSGNPTNYATLVDGVLNIYQIVESYLYINTGIYPQRNSRYSIRIVGKCATGTQAIQIGAFRSGSGSQRKTQFSLTLTTEEKEYVINNFFCNDDVIQPIGFGILVDDFNANNTVTITCAQIFVDNHANDMPILQDIPLFPIQYKYINKNGVIDDAVENYSIAKVTLLSGVYKMTLNNANQGSGLFLCKYTDETYSTLEEVIRNSAINEFIELTSGYYCFSWGTWKSVANNGLILQKSNCQNTLTDSYLPSSSKAILNAFTGKKQEIDILILKDTYNTTAEQTSSGIIMHQNEKVNMSVNIDYSTELNSVVTFKFKARCTSGTQRVFVGQFSSPDSDDVNKKSITLTTTLTEYEVEVEYKALSFGIFGTDAHIGNDVIISSLVVEQGISLVKLNAAPVTFNTEGVLQSISRTDKYLVKVACVGDSLVANPIGGNIPSGLDEGNTMRPIRLLTNNIPRRLYDYLSWNKPVWRRLDHSDWTKSGFSTASWSGVFEGTSETYYTASQQGAYVEITVPQGYEHFGVVMRTKSGNGKVNVTINGNLPSTITSVNPALVGNPQMTTQQLITKIQGNSVINASVCPINVPCGSDEIDLNKGTSSTGNPYAVFEFNNLPSGQANTIRFTTASATTVDIWGGFYWNGKTLVVMNTAHGGHTTSDLISQHLSDELYLADYDAVIFEIPEMNNTRLTLDQTESDIKTIVQNLKGKDVCFTSCNMLGASIVYDTNFWLADGIVSNQLDINNRVRDVLYKLGQPFVDLFQYFRWHVENRGGTLEGGEGGLWYSWDGQHPNPACAQMWVDALKKVIEKTPITLE